MGYHMRSQGRVPLMGAHVREGMPALALTVNIMLPDVASWHWCVKRKTPLLDPGAGA